MIGVLALQGGFAEHLAVLKSLGLKARAVRSADEILTCEALILPGGESTVMMHFIEKDGLKDAIIKQAALYPVYGTCAGLIVLSELGVLDVDVERNAYGSQVQSFIAPVEVNGVGELPAHFIRAPKITRIGAGVEVLAEYDGVPVLVRQANVWGGSFHPELVPTTLVHQMIFQNPKLKS